MKTVLDTLISIGCLSLLVLGMFGDYCFIPVQDWGYRPNVWKLPEGVETTSFRCSMVAWGCSATLCQHSFLKSSLRLRMCLLKRRRYRLTNTAAFGDFRGKHSWIAAATTKIRTPKAERIGMWQMMIVMMILGFTIENVRMRSKILTFRR